VRILAIRGCNLASLAGEFEIDLAHGPLGMAGVFAIVGPTGAGKSTLLDAMCVALFDRTPRLPGHSRVTVGHGEEGPLALDHPLPLVGKGRHHGGCLLAAADVPDGGDHHHRHQRHLDQLRRRLVREDDVVERDAAGQDAGRERGEHRSAQPPQAQAVDDRHGRVHEVERDRREGGVEGQHAEQAERAEARQEPLGTEADRSPGDDAVDDHSASR